MVANAKKFSQFTPGVFIHQTEALPPQDLPAVGTITKVSAGGAWFTVPWTPQHAYGPAPWGLGGYASFTAAMTAGFHPLVGDRALIVFAQAGIGSPVVLAWWR